MFDIPKLTASVAAPLIGSALASEIVSNDKIAFVAILVGTVGVVVAIVSWVNNQIKSQIKAHSKEDRVRHIAIMAEIRHMRELLSLKFGLPGPGPLEVEEDDEPG